jgi:hypothetical protein
MIWQTLARTLDELVVNRARRTVPEIVLRRSKQDIDRCRRLTLKPRVLTVDARNGRHPERGLVRTMQPR